MQEIRCRNPNLIWIFPLGFMDFLFQTSLHVDDVIIVFSYLHASTYLFLSRMQTVRFIGLKCSPPRIEQLLQVMVRHSIALSDM